MENNARNICKTVISGKQQNLNKWKAELGISILFQYFTYILAKFNTFLRSLKPISQFNIFNTAWEPRYIHTGSAKRLKPRRPTCSYADFFCELDRMADFSFGAGCWSSPINDMTRTCLRKRTTDGQGMPASAMRFRLCISFSAHMWMIFRGFNFLKRSLKRKSSLMYLSRALNSFKVVLKT